MPEQNSDGKTPAVMQLFTLLHAQSMAAKSKELMKIHERGAEMGIMAAFGIDKVTKATNPDKPEQTVEIRSLVFSFSGEVSAEEFQSLKDHIAGAMQDFSVGKKGAIFHIKRDGQ